MKKIVFVALVLMGVFCASASDDSFIYWMVKDSATLDEQKFGSSDIPYEARVVAINQSAWSDQAGVERNFLNLYYDMSDATTFGQGVSLNNANNMAYYAGIGNYKEGWTYFIELYHDNTIFARSETGFAYSPDAVATLIEGIQAPTGQLWAVPTFVAAPEPNSALLLLIGCATLALRRRKQLAA